MELEERAELQRQVDALFERSDAIVHKILGRIALLASNNNQPYSIQLK